MMTLDKNHVKTLQIAELISLSIAGTHRVGKATTIHLTNGKIEGQVVGNVRRLRGPTSEGLLIVEIKASKKFRLKMQLDIEPSTDTYSVLMYNVGPERNVSIPGLKSPLKLGGPAFIFVGPNIFAYDGEGEAIANTGYIIKDCPLILFLVGRSMMVQNQFKRKSFTLPSSVTDKDAIIVANINIANVVGGDVLESFQITPSSNL